MNGTNDRMRVLRYCNHFLFSLTWIWLGLGSANKISKSFGKYYNQTSLCSIALHRRRVFSDASNYTSRISVATDQSQCWYERIWPRGRVTWKYQSWSHLISKQNSISRILWPIWTFFRYFSIKGILFISTDFRIFLRHWVSVKHCFYQSQISACHEFIMQIFLIYYLLAI